MVTDALEDYFTKKKSRLGVALMRSMLKEHPSVQAAEALLAFHGSARNAFLKVEVVQLLHALLHPNKVGGPRKSHGLAWVLGSDPGHLKGFLWRQTQLTPMRVLPWGIA